MKQQIWIIAANSSQARFFAAENNNEITEFDSLDHPASRLKPTELETDKPGRSFDRVGPGRHSMSEPVGVKEHEATVFAKEIATTLEKAVAEGKTSKIYIVASPSFLGMLRKNFHAPLEKAIAGEVDKDICMLSTKEIREHLPYVL